MSFAYGALARVHSGGNWDNRSNCGSRSVNLNNLSSNSWSNNGARLASDTRSYICADHEHEQMRLLNPRPDM